MPSSTGSRSRPRTRSRAYSASPPRSRARVANLPPNVLSARDLARLATASRAARKAFGPAARERANKAARTIQSAWRRSLVGPDAHARDIRTRRVPASAWDSLRLVGIAAVDSDRSRQLLHSLGFYTVYVKDLQGRRHVVPVKPTYTVRTFYALVAAVVGQEPLKFNMIFAGRSLLPYDYVLRRTTLHQAGVFQRSTVHLVLRSLG